MILSDFKHLFLALSPAPIRDILVSDCSSDSPRFDAVKKLARLPETRGQHAVPQGRRDRLWTSISPVIMGLERRGWYQNLENDTLLSFI